MRVCQIRNMVVSVLVAGCALAAGNPAQATLMTATLTADNHYGLYVGNEEGTSLRFIGRNELGAAGSPGTYNWSLPETFDFDIAVGEYLYVVAWNVEREHSWIGEFQTDIDHILTNAADWLVTLGGPNPVNFGGSLPPIASIQGQIALANASIGYASWDAPDYTAPQGTSPWGTIPGIDEAAEFIWKDVISRCEDQRYLIFRTAGIAHMPLPAALPMFAAGLLGLAALRRRRAKQAA